MIKGRTIILILLVCHVLVTTGFAAPASKNQQQLRASLQGKATGDVLLKPDGMLPGGMFLAKTRLSLVHRIVNDGGFMYERTGKTMPVPFSAAKRIAGPDSGEERHIHLLYNYPSHNFW